jgi:hypothetical protein
MHSKANFNKIYKEDLKCGGGTKLRFIFRLSTKFQIQDHNFKVCQNPNLVKRLQQVARIVQIGT